MTSSAERSTMDVDAIIMSAPRKVGLESFTVAAPNADEFVVRVELCGICTPEQRVYRGARPTYPYWGGHELCGIVERMPRKAESCLSIGSRVAVALMQRCGACHACRAGLDNHCAYLHPDDPNVRPAGPRGFSSHIVVPAYKVFPVPPDVDAEVAALAEPVACVLRSVRSGGPLAGETAVVLGAGTMGLLHSVLLLLHGCRVVVMDDDSVARSAAAALGAEVAPCDALKMPTRLRALTGEDGPDMIFCTRFGAEGVQAAVHAVARGGRVILYQSLVEDDTITVPANLIHYREIRLIGAVAQSRRDMMDAVALLATHPARFSCLRVEVVPAPHAADAFEQALRPEINRVLLDFRS